MRIVRTRAELREALAELRGLGRTIGFVPTMGWLHEGHLALVDHARARASAAVMSIFVNPLQFGPNEDLAAYPRDLERDTQVAAKRGVELLFAPDVETMYPTGDPIVRVVPGAIGTRLDGAFRPGHFDGVLTVVLKLFGLVQPDVAVFGTGERDAGTILRATRAVLDEEPSVKVQYLELVHPDTLEPVERAMPGSVLAVAAHVGRTRLIDNVVLGE